MFTISDYQMLGESTQEEITADAVLFKTNNPYPTVSTIRVFLEGYPAGQQKQVAAALVTAGVDGTDVSQAMPVVAGSGSTPGWYANPTYWTIWGALSTISGAACAYHGYKRNESVGWAIGWFLFGTFLFPLAPALALAQGFGKPKKD